MTTGRLDLPLLAAAQAQKEMVHNEALAALDLLVQATVVSMVSVVPEGPETGQCWIVGPAPGGAWSDHAGAVATWTAGGWRFASAFDGLAVWHLAERTTYRFDGTQWRAGALRGRTLTLGGEQVVGTRMAAIADVAGGDTIDGQARAAIAAILATLRGHGLIAT